MAKFLFVYHGGKEPQTPEEGEKVMKAWMDWFGAMQSAIVDMGNPVGLSSTVQSDGSVTNDGGSNPVSGYTIISADSMDEATAHAKGCPLLVDGGTVEVAEIHEIG